MRGAAALLIGLLAAQGASAFAEEPAAADPDDVLVVDVVLAAPRQRRPRDVDPGEELVVALGVFDLWGDFRHLTARPADAAVGSDSD